MMNDTLRSAIAADLAPVRPLAPPFRRALTVLPLALLLLVSAPLVFEFRDLTPLGWSWSWGASVTQSIVGMMIVGLALREAVPGRGSSRAAIVAGAASAAFLFLVVTVGAWSASPVTLLRYWWQIGAICLACSAISALPAVVLTAVLIVRAFPLQPAKTGAIAGFGAGLLADAGWR